MSQDVPDTVTSMRLRVEELEAQARIDRSRLHEIGSTVAGIASASRLVHQGVLLSADRKASLEQMLEAEVSRLERLLRPAAAAAPRSFDLDEVVAPLVVSQGARGHVVSWAPSGGLRASGRPDDIAEVLHILLDNAGRHGGGEQTSVEVEAVGDVVRITVSDRGPGIAPAVRGRIFDWEARGPLSSGQGIGLHIAQELVSEHGGRLHLDDQAPCGSTFVIELRAERSSDPVSTLAS